MQVSTGKAQKQKYRRELPVNRKPGPISPGAVNSAGTKCNRGSVMPRMVLAWRAMFPSELE